MVPMQISTIVEQKLAAEAPNRDASAKSMVTVQSELEGAKFLRKGIYKHQPSAKGMLRNNSRVREVISK